MAYGFEIIFGFVQSHFAVIYLHERQMEMLGDQNSGGHCHRQYNEGQQTYNDVLHTQGLTCIVAAFFSLSRLRSRSLRAFYLSYLSLSFDSCILIPKFKIYMQPSPISNSTLVS